MGEIWLIFKRMFSLLKEQSTFWTPIVRMVLINIILFGLFFIGLFNVMQDHLTLGLTLLIISIIGTILRGFYFGYLFGILSAMVFLYLHGNEVTLKNAKRVIHQRIVSLCILHVLTNTFSVLFQRRQNSATPNMFARLVFSSVSIEALDLLGHFLVPVIVIENENLTHSFRHLQELRDHLPATLAGLFGVDITKNIISFLFVPFGFIILGLCVFIGKLTVNLLPPETTLTILNLTFSWLPILIGILFLIFMMTFLRPCMDGLKIIYFTLLYALMRHPEKIQPAKRAEFTGLVNKH